MRKIILLIGLVVPAIILSQMQERQVENPEVLQLKEMHEYIHQMWHEGYPQKNINLLRSLYPDLRKQFQNLKKVEFPEKWQDRQMHWNEGVSAMANTLDSYRLAMKNEDNEALLNAARELHDDFERLVRIVNPPIPAIDNFHKTLFHVYHDYLPSENWDKVRESIDDFQKKMEAINEVILPDRMKDRQEKFNEARENLAKAVAEFAKVKNSEDTEKLAAAVEELHEAYVQMEEAME